ncbi:hypothetical protein GCM10010112_24510 [Actinoplanes lobatus]|uniref:Uncharacterized protein n=1 Tax=Actinoplanes lobatus TaxID=113568 RepID=A0A7W7HJT8_9ACTN|nr:hypothetical protein [Actinoplanes lobatus]MBB4751492.1 hypothetical protein [Actinoplanes lobatus]GGN64366.1 hypothetical protein GCM10010112_24510 [Actinoplanes lobatus]GIE41102.1 hypothetical protein Alo02nite_40000 [Actinoplanes lobatus]
MTRSTEAAGWREFPVDVPADTLLARGEAAFRDAVAADNWFIHAQRKAGQAARWYETGRLAGREADAELLARRRQASGWGAEPQLDQAHGGGDAEGQDQQRQQQDEERGAED